MLFSPCWTQYLDVFKPTVWLDAFCTADMEITAECLNSHFITPFLLTCICCGDWFFFFSALCPLFFFPGPPSSAFISQAAWGGWAGQPGCFRLHRCSKCGAGPTEARGSAQPWTHLQEASERVSEGTQSVCPYVNLTVCPLLGEASCPIFTIYFLTLPASPSRPFTVCPCRPGGLSLYIWPCCSLRAWRWDCHGYCDLLWGWQRGWNPEGGDGVWMLRRVGPRYGKHPVCQSDYTE